MAQLFTTDSKIFYHARVIVNVEGKELEVIILDGKIEYSVPSTEFFTIANNLHLGLKDLISDAGNAMASL